ncbi:phosphatase PAP2 family protein [Streptomyces thinghirensis]|nr:phosphatase PAP2 family protein [Streptomyces thinghirensis]
MRQLKRQPITTSFPSGHAASAAAFATGVALESPAWGAAVAPVAAAVALSRIYTGVHYPSDVVAGAVLGAGAAFAVRGMVPTRAQLTPAGPAARRGPRRCPVARVSSWWPTSAPGTSDRVRGAVRRALPDAGGGGVRAGGTSGRSWRRRRNTPGCSVCAAVTAP